VAHHAAPRVRGGIAARVASLLLGLALFGFAIVLILESKLGLSPWDVMNQGISRHSPLSFGVANIVVGLLVLLLAWSLGGPPGWGTLANAVLVGATIQGLVSIDWITDLAHEPLGVRAGLLIGGIVLIGPATAFYIGADFGAGPRDTLMLVGARRSGRRVGLVRAVLELCALVAGVVLGGTFGVGTIAFALGVGPIIEAAFWLLARSPLAAAVPASAAVIVGE
jgi:uncharacterized protein